MIKRSLVLVVSVVCTGLLMPAVASAGHPWNPPVWYVEVSDGGEFRGESNYDCVVRHGEDPPGTSDPRHWWSHQCSRTYPGGIARCSSNDGRYASSAAEWWTFTCTASLPSRTCGRRAERQNSNTPTDNGWQTGSPPNTQPDPACVDDLRRPAGGSGDRDADGVEDGQDRCPDVAGPSGGCPAPPSDDPSGAAGHDLVSLCGTARFNWYRTGSFDPDVEKGDEACLHTVSNRVAQQLAVDGLKKMPEVFGRRLVEWAQGKLVPDPEDLIQRALPNWDRAFRVAGRLNVITRIGEAAGIVGVAVGRTWMVNQIANRDACVMFITSTSTNLSVDGSGSTSFAIDGWNIVYNRKSINNYSKRDAYRHTAHVRQKKKRILLDKYEQRLTSMRCGKGGKVFLAKKHDEKKIVSNRVRAAG